MEKLLAFLEQIHPLSEECRLHLQGILQARSLKRREFLLAAGQTCRNIYFLDAGLVRCFYVRGEREISSWFMQEGDVIVAVASFFSQQPSTECIQALETSELQFISYADLEATYRLFPSFNIHGRILLTHYYRLSEQRAQSMRALRARDRFAFLLAHQPELLQRVPRKYLASYLGVTEATLSNIHNRSLISQPR